jgi:hypothetical protein
MKNHLSNGVNLENKGDVISDKLLNFSPDRRVENLYFSKIILRSNFQRSMGKHIRRHILYLMLQFPPR